ncbi:FAD-binding protein [Chitinophaga rhizophila]|uniref:FAD-binding protein n=1 Tax=Chitinophaga rhizophila TaxID=2866212 RepID=A0ABS7G839_9BACT|nr:FAD-binding protein [Chitinophaga rhizophila]MBW8682949.1 FAD-binding protein [Chitinophaga rhizophila]
MKIVRNGAFSWSNEHGTFSQRVKDLYDLANETTGSALEIYNDTTLGIQQIIREAISSGTPLRALGGSWSFTPIAATQGIILNTRPLNIRFPVSAASVSPRYKGHHKYLCLAQCGNRIWELNKYFNDRGQSLSSSGASNGQTIAGAIATGTHGAALDFGALQENVVALHIITGPDSQLWLERASYPVMDDTFPDRLGADLMRDDEVFDAALVGIGAMGFIHGVMIEAVDDFLLESYQRRVPYDETLVRQLTTLDFSDVRLPYPGERPFHMQMLINPYDMANGVYATTMYKRPFRNDYTPPGPNGAGIGPGDDAPCFIGKLAGMIPGIVPVMVTKVLGESLHIHERQFGRLGEIFSNTTLRGKVASAAVGIPLSAVPVVVQALMEVNASAGPFVGLFAFRFVKSSKAVMAFTRYAPVTCVMELDGVLSPETQHFYDAVWTKLDQLQIPFTFHWGKMCSIHPERLRHMYGDSLDRFLIARSKIIDPATAAIFSNDVMKTWGIDNVS